MIKIWLRVGGKAALAAVVAFGLARSATADVIVLSNHNTPGDLISGPSGDEAVGASGWTYANVTSGGAVGINTNLPRSGNGSVYFNPVNLYGTGGVGKADIIYATGSPLGQFKDLAKFAYEWYRVSANSTTGLTQTVALKLMLSNSATTYYGATSRGELVFEPYYTTGNVVSDQWVPEDIITNNSNMWATNTLLKPSGYQYQAFETFRTAGSGYDMSNYYVWGVIAGVGSGWAGTFEGAADNITFGFTGGDNTTYNFEVRPPAVPEPGSIVMGLIAGGLGLAGAAWRRRRVG